MGALLCPSPGGESGIQQRPDRAGLVAVAARRDRRPPSEGGGGDDRHEQFRDQERPTGGEATGVKAIVTLLRARLPETKILLLGIFPRGATSSDSIRLVNESINARLRGFADGQHLFYLDLGHLFLDRDGRLKRDLMPDLLHPNEQGYRVWAEGMEPQLKALLGE